MSIIKEKRKTAFDTLKDELGISNPNEVPRLQKVVVNVGTGSNKDSKKEEIIIDRLAKITGQKPAPRAAKQSIAAYKLREGDIVGYQVTLRGDRMDSFLDRLLNVALPRTKDFRGISVEAIDDMGNYTLGIKEHTIFPETSDEDIKNVFGMSVTFVTTSKNKKDALAYLGHLGLPFKKIEQE